MFSRIFTSNDFVMFSYCCSWFCLVSGKTLAILVVLQKNEEYPSIDSEHITFMKSELTTHNMHLNNDLMTWRVN